MKPSPSDQAPSATKVWDPFVRIFHWSLVTCVVLNQFVLEDGKTAHEWVGYTASALVLARVVWGFVGSRHARFSDFFPTPGRLARHVQALRRTREHLDMAQAVAHQQPPALDLLAEELRLAHDALGEITGAFSADDLLGEIFSKFCIGK